MKGVKLYREYFFVRSMLNQLYDEATQLKQLILCRHGKSKESANVFRSSDIFKDLTYQEYKEDIIISKILRSPEFEGKSWAEVLKEMELAVAESVDNSGYGSNYYKENK